MSSLNKFIPLVQQARVTGTKAIQDSILEAVGDAKVVMIGEASHGTHEFYQQRAEITKRLIKEKGFDCVCIEGDWPDAYQINRYVRGLGSKREAFSGFKSRFPTWMWRNTVTVDFASWLRDHNDKTADQNYKIGFYGLDLYSLYQSSVAVIDFLKENDPDFVSLAKKRYCCFDRENLDPQSYGLASAFNSKKSCQEGAVKMLQDMRQKYADQMQADGMAVDGAFYAKVNAQVVKDAEEYYRGMFLMKNTWNIRDKHMANTLDDLLKHFEQVREKDNTPQFKDRKQVKAVIWAHNSHLGDSGWTEFKERGELNVGKLVREKYGLERTYNVGFSTYTGTVTAAHEWDDPAQTMRVRPSEEGTYEHFWHKAGEGQDLGLRFRANPGSKGLSPAESKLASALEDTELMERAIGVVYRPMTEKQSHLFNAVVVKQFDSLIHIENSSALKEIDDSFLAAP
jgi:erythromycin esterase-like protein